MINEGIYYDLSSEAYHGDKDSISRSALMEFKKSPYRYWAKHLNPDRPKEESKPSWEFGTAFHTLILEPHLFAKHYFIMPEKVLLKNVGREKYDEYKKVEEEAETTDKQVLSRSDYNRLRDMQGALSRHQRASELVGEAVYESSYFWQDEHSGLRLKCRPDILHANMYVDLKTIHDASPQNYQREMAKHGYHIQAAMVKDGVKAVENRELSACINICVEPTYPYSIGIYIIDEFALETGHLEYKQSCLDLKAAKESQSFPDYGIQTIGLPRWAI